MKFELTAPKCGTMYGPLIWRFVADSFGQDGNTEFGLPKKKKKM